MHAYLQYVLNTLFWTVYGYAGMIVIYLWAVTLISLRFVSENLIFKKLICIHQEWPLCNDFKEFKIVER